MSTTALFSEILVGGILALTWLVLGTMGILEKRSLVELIGEHSLALGAVLLAYSYALGVVFDRLWDVLTKPIDRHVRSRLGLTDDSLRALRREVVASGGHALEFLEYIRSRMRIARALLCNAVLIGAAAAFWIYRAQGMDPFAPLGLILFSTAAATLLSFFAFQKLLKTYYTQLREISVPVERR